MKKPFPAPGQSVLHPNLERNFFLIMWLVLLFSIFMGVTARGQLLNISTRGYVGKDDQVLIAGFILKSDTKVVIRALGPSLPLAGKLSDPVLELHDAAGVLKASNDDYAINSSNPIPPSSRKESVIMIGLTPGRWTAIVKGKGNSTGIGMVEVYDVTPVPSPTATPIPVTRGLTINWTLNTLDGQAWAGTVKDQILYYGYPGNWKEIHTDKSSLVLPDLVIGKTYGFVVDVILPDGAEHFSQRWSCTVTLNGCQ